MSTPSESKEQGVPGGWPETRWDALQSIDKSEAIAFLCREYRDAIVRWFFMQTRSRELAEDLTHSFLHSKLRAGQLGFGQQAGIRFRSWLVSCLRNHLTDHARSRAGKNAAAAEAPLDDQEVCVSPGEALQQLDAEVAVVLHARILGSLRRMMQQRGHEDRFNAMADHLPAGSEPAALVQVGQALGLSRGAMRVALFRLREAYLALFDEETRRMAPPGQLDDERRYLMTLIARHACRG